MKTIKNLGLLCGIALTTLAGAGTAQALTLVPPSLTTPGQQYRLLFVTSTTRDATSTDINDYNTFVNSAANTVPELTALGTSWKAIGSTETVSARANTDTLGTGGVPIFLLNGTKVANDNGDLWDGSITAPINITESGAVLLTSQVFTGSDVQGLQAFTNLGGGDIIPNYLGAVNRFANVVAVGDVVFTSDRWITGNGGTSSLSSRFFGISGVLTVPGATPVGTPEPSSLLGFITLGGFLLGSGVVRKAKK